MLCNDYSEITNGDIYFVSVRYVSHGQASVSQTILKCQYCPYCVNAKKYPVIKKMLPPVVIEPRPLIASDSKSNSLLSELVRHVLLWRSLNFCPCTT